MRGKCCLCGDETDEQTELYVGSCLTWTHKSCMKIVEKYIDRLENWEGIMKKVDSINLKRAIQKEKVAEDNKGGKKQ